MSDIQQPQFMSAEAAREHLEQMRWPNGATCVHCGSTRVYKLQAKLGSKKAVRPGVYKCAECREQFSVTIGSMVNIPARQV